MSNIDAATITGLRTIETWLETAERFRSFGADPGTALTHALDDTRALIATIQGPSLQRRGLTAITTTPVPDGAA